jgi:hypothetical protein
MRSSQHCEAPDGEEAKTMSEAKDAQRANRDDESPDPRATMGIGEAASLLGLSVAQVRKLCKAYEHDPGEGLAFAWTSSWVQRTDINGHKLRGHRRPYRDAVEAMAAAKQRAERNPSV